jgi:hypothetical protein
MKNALTKQLELKALRDKKAAGQYCQEGFTSVRMIDKPSVDWLITMSESHLVFVSADSSYVSLHKPDGANSPLARVCMHSLKCCKAVFCYSDSSISSCLQLTARHASASQRAQPTVLLTAHACCEGAAPS